MLYVLALLMGLVAGLRAMMPAAAVSWAAYLGLLKLDGTWLSFLGSIWTVVIFTVLAIGELVTDQLPSIPSRKVPAQFGGRVLMGAVAGIAIAGPAISLPGALAGIVGAVIGTLGGAELRGKLAASFGKDRPAAFIEDAVAIVGAALIVLALK
ncbi:membrane protein [soil metagenome]